MVRFDLPEASRVQLRVFSISGRLAATLLDRELGAGTHEQVLSTSIHRDMTPGVYFIRLEARGASTGTTFRETRKVVVVP